ncbi:MAG TPA: hypothetical protein PLX15_05415 [Candidatus Woesearchaeota archaeon]|nr:hypothetical protein [Candidatus Woesearchaeota archaeon]
MNEIDVKNYLLNPNITPLNGFVFTVNYSALSTNVPDELVAEEITKINSQYNPKFFNLLLKISRLLEETGALRSHLLINHEAVKNIFLKYGETKIFNFINPNQMIILSNSVLIEIESLNENNFELKIFSLDSLIITSLKSEILNLHNSHNEIFENPTDISITNSNENEFYVQLLFNILIEDFLSSPRRFSIFVGLNIKLKTMLFGTIRKSNHAFLMNEDSLFIGAISLMSLVIENRLAHIYEIENGTYNDDKTLGQLITELNNQGHLNGIQVSLNNFKDIRNNIIHYHRRTFNIYNSFIESIKYLGHFLIWCKDNGRL